MVAVEHLCLRRERCYGAALPGMLPSNQKVKLAASDEAKWLRHAAARFPARAEHVGITCDARNRDSR